MRLHAKSSIPVLFLTILLLISPTACTAGTETALPDSLQIVPKRLLRDANRRIDQQDLRIMFLENRVAERDSILESRDLEAQDRVEYWRTTAVYAQEQLRKSVKLWDKLLPMIILGLGFYLGSL